MRKPARIATASLVIGIAWSGSAMATDGRIVYSDSTTTPQNRTYAEATNTFGANTSTGVAGAGQTFIVNRACPLRTENMVGYVTTGGALYVIRWSGAAWSAEWGPVTVGGAGVNGRRFDIAYEAASGRAMVVYSNNTAGANELRYNVWNGTAWTGATTLDSARLTGTPNWVKLASRPGTSQIAATIADTNNVLTTLIWDGAAWGNEPLAAHTTTLYRSAATGDCDDFDNAWESQGGDLFVIYTDQAPQQYHQQYIPGTGWQAASSWATARGGPLQMFAAADPRSDRILLGFNRGASATMYARVWSGTAMSGVLNPGNTGITPAVNRKTIAGGFVTSGATTAAVVVWMNNAAVNNRIDYGYSTDNGATWTQNQTATFAGTSPGEKRWMVVDSDTTQADRLMATFSDLSNDLWAKRLVYAAPTTFTWSNSDGGAALTATLASITTQNFCFAYERPYMTVGNGIDPGNASLCPGGALTDLDSFTLQTSSGTDTVTAVTVTLAAGTSAGIGTLSITNNAGSTTYGSVTNPASDTVTVTLTTNITATTTSSQYKVRIQPRAHAAMPVPPGASYAVTGTVTGLTSGYTKVYSDTGSATVTIDNLSPGDATWGTVSPGDGQIVLNWTNPGDADFIQVVILRNTVSITDAPTEGATYAQGNLIGASVVRYVGSAQTFTDTFLTNGTDYYYKIFAKDTCGNYSTGVQTGPHRPGPTTTVGDGTNPGASSLCPGGALTDLDAFTLWTSSGTDTITAVTVTLAAGTSAAIGTLSITNDAGSTTYGSVTNPVSDTVAVALTTSITATTTSTQHKVRIQPRSHAAMPAPPGSAYAVTGTVTAITSGNNKSYADSASATVTIDNLSPSDATWGSIVPGDAQIVLNWTNPGDADFSQVVILRSTATIADAPVEGATYVQGNTIGTSVVRYAGALQTFTDTGLTNGTDYYYKVFAKDNCGNYSVGAETGPHRPTPPVNPVTPSTVYATIDSCTQITVKAPFTGDSDLDGSASFDRGPTAGGPFTSVCPTVVGPSPRSCIDAGVGGGSTSYYRITFSDPDGVTTTNAPNPQTMGPYVTPVCTAPGTTIGTMTAAASSCSSAVASCTFTGDGDRDGTTLFEYGPTSTGPWTAACLTVSGPSPRQCTVTGLSASTTYWFRATFSDPDGVTGVNPTAAVSTATTACGADAVAPTITMLSPARDAIVSGVDYVRVQVYDAGGLSGVNPVQFQVDGAGATYTMTVNGNYPSCGTGCSVYEYQLPAQAAGPHYLSIRATDNASPANNVARLSWSFRAATAKVGAGSVLRRTVGSQLCLDCHNLQTHDSHATSTQYGNWAIDCLTCHTPHKTKNLFLVRPTIQTPSSGGKTVDFRSTTGKADYSYATVTSPGNGPCEVCHTRTKNQDSTPRYRNTGESDGGKHYSSRCTNCHPHKRGFAAGESEGGNTCGGCHPVIWEGMNGTTAKSYKHALGNTSGVNDSFSDSGITWSSPLSGNAASVRSCVNMCHQDHIHNNPGGSTHDYNVHQDATTGASRAVTRNPDGTIATGTPNRTDFNGVAATGGQCLSCHQYQVDSSHPAVGKAAFDASAHDYTTFGGYGAWTYALHDGSSFDRNCTKCHADRADARPSDGTTPFGAVHFSDYDSLLAGTTRPAGAPASFVCYNCHGNGTTGVDYSGKDIATQIAKTYNHPVNSDNVHDTITEGAATYNDGKFSGANRHANCLDCHDPHRAGPTKHTQGVNTVVSGNPLYGASGLIFTPPATNFAATGSGNFATTSSVTKEYEVCLKCHSSFAFGASPPTGQSGVIETDVAQEFSTSNQSYHPIVAALPATDPGVNGSSQLTDAQLTQWTTVNWRPAGSKTMYCSDCHGADANSPAVQGPHGSAYKFFLRRSNWDTPPAGSGTPGVYWPTQSDGVTLWTLGANPADGTFLSGLFCLNCHPMRISGGNSDASWSGNHVHFEHSGPQLSNVACIRCHILVPHGGKLSRLIADGGGLGGTTMPARYSYQSNLANSYLGAFTKSATPGGYATANCQSSNASCGTHSGSTPSENW